MTLLFPLLLQLGCDQTTPAPKQSPQPVIRLIDDLLSHHDGQLTGETWYVHKIEGAKIGHRWTRTYNVQVAKRELIRTLSIDELRIPRFGRVIDQSIRSVTLTSENGQVLQLAYRMKSGRTERTYHATVSGDQLHWEQQDAKRRKGTLPWNEQIGGYTYLEQHFRAHPLKPNETRTVQMMMPLIEQPVKYRMVAKVDGSQIELYSAQQKSPSSTIRIDDQGLQQQTFRFLSREMTRCTEIAAMSPNDRLDFDIAFAMSVPVSDTMARTLNAPQPVRQFQVTIKDANPLDLLPSGGGQTLTPINEHTALITVRAPVSEASSRSSSVSEASSRSSSVSEASSRSSTSPSHREGLEHTSGEGLPSTGIVPSTSIAPSTDTPTAADIQPNRWLETKHRNLREFVQSANLRTNQPLEAAETLRQHVHRQMDPTDLGNSLATAAQTASSKSGDCTEHAMLLAASCRASQIPARVAIGLLFDPNQQAFVYHMWTEVWDGRTWQPMDATQSEYSTNRIKLSHTNLNGESDYSIIAPVIRLTGQLTITAHPSNQPQGVSLRFLPSHQPQAANNITLPTNHQPQGVSLRFLPPHQPQAANNITLPVASLRATSGRVEPPARRGLVHSNRSNAPSLSSPGSPKPGAFQFHDVKSKQHSHAATWAVPRRSTTTFLRQHPHPSTR